MRLGAPRRFSRRLGHATLAVVCLSLAACTAQKPAKPGPPPTTLPTAAQLLDSLATRRDSVRGLRALAKLRYRHPDGSTTSNEAIVVSRPDRLRVEVLSLFGAVFVLTTESGDFTAYVRQENTIYRGDASPENMWRYARIGLPVVDLIDLMLGTPPQREAVWSHVSYDGTTGWTQLSQELDPGIQVVWVDAGLPQAAEYRDAHGDIEWRVLFEEYNTVADVPIATRIRLEVPDAEHSVEISLTDVDLNPELPSDTFHFADPPGSRVEKID